MPDFIVLRTRSLSGLEKRCGRVLFALAQAEQALMGGHAINLHRSARVQFDDMVELHEARRIFSLSRPMGVAARRVHIFEVRHSSQLHDVPPCDFHRFSIQLSGKQNVIRFDMDKLLKPAPAKAVTGAISFVPAGLGLSAHTTGDPFHAFQILISRPMMRWALEQVQGHECDDEGALFGFMGPAQTARISQLARLMRDEASVDRGGDQAILDALSTALCVEFARTFSAPSSVDGPIPGFSEEQRDTVVALMEAAVDGSLSLGDIADRIGVEPYLLTRNFKAYFGETPQRYLIDLRIAKARELLEASDMPLAQIAFACGFSSQSHMTSCFTKRLGASPGRYRDKQG